MWVVLRFKNRNSGVRSAAAREIQARASSTATGSGALSRRRRQVSSKSSKPWAKPRSALIQELQDAAAVR